MTHTFVTCPDCGHRLELAQDDEDKQEYYFCDECGTDWTLDGKKKMKR